MASSYKYLGVNDRVVSTTDLSEEVELEKSSGWSATGLPNSTKPSFVKYASGSTDVFDVTIGKSSDVAVGPSLTLDREAANYNQIAKVLLGHNVDGTILKFSLDADASTTNNILHNAIFVNFARSQFKDKIKSGTFSMLVNVTGSSNLYLSDTSGTVGPIVRECQTGEVGLLFVSGSIPELAATVNVTGGLLFYEAGIAVVSPYIFAQSGAASPPSSEATTTLTTFNTNSLGILNGTSVGFSSSYAGDHSVGFTFLSASTAPQSSSLSSSAYGFSTHFLTASFQSDTELNSTVYFCRAFNNEFNYSSNPTYLSSGEIYVKEGDPMNQPVAYITSVGLYDDNNQLLAVAKLSEPVKKTPDTELIARVRLDF
jgi:hypothetical protein